MFDENVLPGDNETAQDGQANQPANLEDALRMVRAKDSQADEPAESQESISEAGQRSRISDVLQSENAGGMEESGSEIPQAGDQSDDASSDDSEFGRSGGSADLGQQDVGDDSVFGEIDYSSIGSNLMQSATRQAAMDTNRFFQEQGIEKVSINQLYQRDESGRVTFVNPDDPNNPFGSRAEAQQWIDAYNAQIDYAWNEHARGLQQQYINDTAPALRLIQFVPTYERMSEKTRDIFDTLIEPYTVRDSAGMAIGYNCDLDMMSNQAERIAQSLGFNENDASKQTQAIGGKVSSGPAMDMSTSGSDSLKDSNAEPKTLAEAIKMVRDSNKKGGKK